MHETRNIPKCIEGASSESSAFDVSVLNVGDTLYVWGGQQCSQLKVELATFFAEHRKSVEVSSAPDLKFWMLLGGEESESDHNHLDRIQKTAFRVCGVVGRRPENRACMRKTFRDSTGTSEGAAARRGQKGVVGRPGKKRKSERATFRCCGFTVHVFPKSGTVFPIGAAMKI